MIIKLGKGMETTVDDDFKNDPLYNWIKSKTKYGAGYVVRCVWQSDIKKNRTDLLHHYVLLGAFNKPPKGFSVDHIDGNTLNNRKSNLRLVTNRQNLQNSYRHRNGKLVGAGFHKARNAWRSFIRIGKKQVYLGSFKDKFRAHQAYLNALACLNLKLPI